MKLFVFLLIQFFRLTKDTPSDIDHKNRVRKDIDNINTFERLDLDLPNNQNLKVNNMNINNFNMKSKNSKRDQKTVKAMNNVNAFHDKYTAIKEMICYISTDFYTTELFDTLTASGCTVKKSFLPLGNCITFGRMFFFINL